MAWQEKCRVGLLIAWRATLRRSSHRATDGNPGGELLAAPLRGCVDGWFSVLAAYRPSKGEAKIFNGRRRRSADAELWRPCESDV